MKCSVHHFFFSKSTDTFSNTRADTSACTHTHIHTTPASFLKIKIFRNVCRYYCCVRYCTPVSYCCVAKIPRRRCVLPFHLYFSQSCAEQTCEGGLFS